jgi:dCMP deaminase
LQDGLVFVLLFLYNEKNNQEDSHMKRTDYISWDEYFMGIAMLAAKRSKDPSTQVGACIVSPDNIIISTGYNGMPKGCSDDEFPWEREGAETKYPYVVHAELNAILNANGRDLRNSRVYVALFPCNECAKAIIQSGVKEVIYLSDKYADTLGTMASKRMLDAAKVRYRQLQTDVEEITLSFIPPEKLK